MCKQFSSLIIATTKFNLKNNQPCANNFPAKEYHIFNLKITKYVRTIFQLKNTGFLI